ncbi:MAG: DUF2845 domain-containing protein [Gammaproteobacteria bacterium]|nr:DUF2845 domain-containing protein [Gammaproteobacteria bacterium]MBU1554740.1 DUF2845 domain-containing protein [Gammaproteobacteria bacterium]MBU2070115.1 DUF2845 domain-containing protein [Gammaproteobacteria bacterium]MBU2183111.1 DUF2845 domain-containing protein [Gammaproteobacteria bacterium]MBU2205440.1 DUF2845 domain-containing protein [Gammaproteobacteria bacterium]
MRFKTMLTISSVILTLVAWPSQACGFRLSSGKLLSCGMPRIEVLALAGEPAAKDVETLGVDTGEPVKGETIETWSYKLKNDMGNDYLVSLTLQAGKVTAIWSKQQNR